MFGLSPVHLLLFAVVVLILFGRGKVSEFMGDFGKGVKSFKQGMSDEHNPPPVVPPVAQIPPGAGNHAALNGETVIDPASKPPQ